MNNQLITIDDDSLDLVCGGADAGFSFTFDPIGDLAKGGQAIGQAIEETSKWIYDNTFGLVVSVDVSVGSNR